jgi:multidrug efflux pump
MVSVLGFSFSGRARTPRWPSSRSRTGPSARAPASRPGAVAGPRLRRADGRARCVHLPAQPAADPRARPRRRLQLPPAGPRRAGHDALLAARNQLLGLAGAEQAAHRRAPRRPGRRAAAAARHRPRQGQCAGRGLRRHQQRAVHDAGLGLCQRLPERRPVAARGGAGRCAGAHAARGPAAHQRAQQRAGRCRCRPSPARAGSPARCRPCATTATPRCASRARPRRAFQQRRGDGRDGAPGRAAAPGFAFEWTGQSREERLAGATGLILFGFSLLAVFLCLAALYESWSIPLSVLLVVPLGVLGVLLGANLRGLANDVYFKVGLITIIGLSAKNAVLIIEFAKDLQAQGKSLCRGRAGGGPPALPPDPDDLDGLHPGRAAAGAGQRRRLGQPARHRHRRDGRHDQRHVLAVFFVPVFFVVVRRCLQGQRAAAPLYAHEPMPIGADRRLPVSDRTHDVPMRTRIRRPIPRGDAGRLGSGPALGRAAARRVRPAGSARAAAPAAATWRRTTSARPHRWRRSSPPLRPRQPAPHRPPSSPGRPSSAMNGCAR